jgi:hypothetical protein
MASKKSEKPVDKKKPKDAPECSGELDQYGLPKPPEESPEFEAFARKVMQVPKSEIDAEERKEKKRKAKGKK